MSHSSSSEKNRKTRDRDAWATYVRSMAAVTLGDFAFLEDIPDALLAGVYVLFGEGPRPLYVGQSALVRQRVQNHKRAQKWGAQVEYCLVYPCADREERLVLETLMILAERPKFNRQVRLLFKKDGTIYEMQWGGRAQTK